MKHKNSEPTAIPLPRSNSRTVSQAQTKGKDCKTDVLQSLNCSAGYFQTERAKIFDFCDIRCI